MHDNTPTFPRQFQESAETGRGRRRRVRLGEVTLVETVDTALVWLTGEVDLAMDDDLFSTGRRLRKAGLPVEVDVGALTFADATLLGWLSSLSRVTSVTVVDPSPTLRDLLALADLAVVVR